MVHVPWQALSWLWESTADGQKLWFLAETRKLPKEEARKAVLGHPPFDGARFWQWTCCRHPNYWGEWAAWSGLALAALPSALRHGSGALTRAGLVTMLALCSRFLYDCLMYWTGAEPAEHFSAKKRPEYKDYQCRVRVFWPFQLPFVDHGLMPGWPSSNVA